MVRRRFVRPVQPHTLDEVRKLPHDERRYWVEDIRVAYPKWSEIKELIEKCHEKGLLAASPTAPPPGGLLILGPSGAGKTTLLKAYAEQYPPYETDTGTVRPVVFAGIPSNASVKDLATEILLALGDDRAHIGTAGNMKYRIRQYFQDCQVELLILDEVQHFVDQESEKVLKNAANWLKVLIKDTKVVCVMAGIEPTATRVLDVDVDGQLARHFGKRGVLEPYCWDDDRDEVKIEFRKLMAAIEAQLPLQEKSYLSNENTAHRCYVACGGIIGYLMPLIRSATHKVLEERREKIEYRHLADAFKEELASLFPHVQNPFLSEGEFHPVADKKVKPVRDPSSTNRRSKRRKEHKETANDLLG